MSVAILLPAMACLVMLLPYLPGRFDASSATLSFLARVVALASLALAPVGLAWMLSRRRASLWHRLALALAGLAALATTLAAVAVNQLAMGVMIGMGAFAGLREAHRRSKRLDARGPTTAPVLLVVVPVVLATFQATLLRHAADWSRDRAIRHSAPLVAEIEAFRERRGHYPASLQSLNRDVPTGVVGIERFLYEANGEAYNLFFVRPHVELDAWEVVMFNPRDEHRFTSHELDVLQYDGEQLDRRRGDRRRTALAHPHWVSILFD